MENVKSENVPFYKHCKIHGHAFAKCFILHPHLRKEKAKDIGNNLPINVPSAYIDDADTNKECVDPSNVIPFDGSKPVEDIEELSSSIPAVPKPYQCECYTIPEAQICNQMTFFDCLRKYDLLKKWIPSGFCQLRHSTIHHNRVEVR
ncbi:hypothetical protein IEQ34_017357 [Dendrobium chrysotoxum]|uniref:Uncharacterized protein n=1 Tax=Dendrobium chrysotoxum TaxID=161865 RepID=A0AAV7GCC3_DENCH|nr:hypothetical protein IEQ34_017357 [Dendrobium chrysotoxum]